MVAARGGGNLEGVGVVPKHPNAYIEVVCGGGGTVDAMLSKGIVRKGVWVRFPPAASN